MTVVRKTDVVLAFTVTVLVTVAVGSTTDVTDEADESFTLEEDICVEITVRGVEIDTAGTSGSATLSCVTYQYTVAS